MKRLFYLVFAALAVFACDKPQVEPKPTPGPDDDQKEQTGGYDSISIVLKASNVKTAWADGDALQVYCVTADGADVEAKYVLSSGAGSATGTFVPATGVTAVPKGGRDYFAAYPYDEDRTFAQHNTFTVVVPADQTAATPLFAAASEATTLELASFMGAVKFTLSGKADLKQITLDDKNGNSILSGNVTYNAKTGKATFKNASASKNSINYIFATALNLNNTTSDPIILEVPAGSLEEGAVVTLFDVNNNALATIDVAGQTIEAGKVNDLGNFNFESADIVNDLCKVGTANCYIIPGTGTYKFKAVKGNSDEAVAAASVEVFWETRCDSLDVAPGTIVKSVKLEGSDIVVEMADPLQTGNALIAAKNSDGEILWSWHLWIPQGEVQYIEHTPTEEGELAFYDKPVMDRNLGAIVPTDTTGMVNYESFGLAYQWGRKDPLVQSKYYKVSGAEQTSVEGAQSIAYFNAHPNENTEGVDNDWNIEQSKIDNWDLDGNKTVYDPCPVGYRVPVYNTEYQFWRKREDDFWKFNPDKGWFYFKATGLAFPLCGWISGGGVSRYMERICVWSATPGLGSEEQPRGSAALFNLKANEGQMYNYHSYFRYAGGSIRCVPEH